MEITISGAADLGDPRIRVLATESLVKTMCEHAKLDAADGVMVLLTAAVHISRMNQRPGSDIELALARALGAAIVASDDFFTLRETPKGPAR